MQTKYVCLALAVGLGVATVVACGSGTNATDDGTTSGGQTTGEAGIAAACGAVPATGCSCGEEGMTVPCGKVNHQVGDFVVCSEGKRRCTNGRWEACLGEEITTKSLSGSGVHISALGTPSGCTGADPCDPYCNQTTDDPTTGFTPPAGFSIDGGLTPSGTAGPAPCAAIAITPLDPTVTVTAIKSNNTINTSPSVTNFAVTAPGCSGASNAQWTLDAPDTATIGATSGTLQIVNPIIRVFNVTVYAYGLSATTTVTVQVNADDGLGNGNAAVFNNAPSGSDTDKILYPYDNTVFPLGLPGPVVQWDSTGYVAGQTVMVELKYAPATGPQFVWKGYMTDASPGRYESASHVFPVPLAWSSFEQSAKGQSAEIDFQRLKSGNSQVYPAHVIPLKFATASLKGTVYYQSYNSVVAGNVGAVLAIKPGATSPVVPYTTGYPGDSAPGSCHVCHAVSADGSTLQLVDPLYNNAAFFTLSSGSATFLRSDTAAAKKFNWGAFYPDGSFMFSNSDSGNSTYNKSSIWRTSDSANILSNFPNGARASMPAFSPDGTKVAFSYPRGPALAATPAGSVIPGGAAATTDDLVISQVYGGGGDAGAVYRNDFIELFNRGTVGVSLNGKSLQYATTAANFSNAANVINLPNYTMDPGSYYLVQLSSAGAAGALLPAADLTAAINIDNTNGKIALVNSAALLNGCGAAASQCAAGSYLDLVGYGSASQKEGGSAVGALSVVKTAFRKEGGCTDANANNTDFTVTTLSPAPSPAARPARNSATTPLYCTCKVADSTLTPSYAGVPASNSLDQCSLGQNMVVMDFNCNRPGPGTTCGGTAPAWSFTNARNVFNGAAPLNGEPAGSQVVWTSFLPSGAGIVFERKIRIASGASWSDPPETRYGSLGELWFSDVPADNTAANRAKPIRLNQANGLTAAGVNYLPQGANGHTDGNTIHWEAEDGNCAAGNGPSAESQLNYMPTINPAATGGYNWLVFMSRRLYGNTLTRGPFGCEPSASTTGEWKKLWVAALDGTPAAGNDPSHPALYLPGQELAAGNERAFWALSPCSTAGSGAANVCDTTSDCCGGLVCKVDTDASGNPTLPVTKHCKTPTSCAAIGGSCISPSDCCDPAAICTGNQCQLPAAGVAYTNATYTRDFDAQCPAGSRVKWQLFEFQDIIPAGTSMGFRVASADTSAGLATAMPRTLGTKTTASLPATWDDNGITTDAALVAGGDSSKEWLRVFMDFNTIPTAAPVMTIWRQLFDCIPNE